MADNKMAENQKYDRKIQFGKISKSLGSFSISYLKYDLDFSIWNKKLVKSNALQILHPFDTNTFKFNPISH